MNTDPIICSGNDLAKVCEDLQARGFVPWAVDASVKTNAGYRVSYFERVPEQGSDTATKNVRLSNRVAARGDQIHDALNPLNAGNGPMNSAGKSPKGSDQVTPEELRATNPQSGLGRQTESRVEDCHQHSLAGDKNGEGLAVANDQPEREIKHSRKLDSLPSIYGGKTISLKTPRDAEDSRQTNEGEAQRTHPQDCTAVITSIEDRMKSLKERLTASGQLRRSKPSTEQKYARLPHAND